jgi:hypothetical protein
LKDFLLLLLPQLQHLLFTLGVFLEGLTRQLWKQTGELFTGIIIVPGWSEMNPAVNRHSF